MRYVKVILVVACLAGIASAASWPENPLVCAICKKAIEGFKEHLPAIEKQVIDQCQQLEEKADQEKCIESVKHWIDRWSKESPEQICQELDKCPRKRDFLSEARQTIDKLIGHIQERPNVEHSAAACEACKKSMEAMMKVVSKIEHDMTANCEKLDTKEKQKECIATVKSLLDKLSSQTPEQICQDLARCPRETCLFGRARQAIDKLIGHFQKKSTHEKPPQTCDECKAEVKKAKEHLPELEREMIDFCKKIPNKDGEEKCVKKVKEVIDYLAKNTPEKICEDKGLCPHKLPFFGLVREPQPMCSMLCEPCKQIAAQIIAGAPQAQEQLKKLCKNCGAPENVQKCEQFIDQLMGSIEQMTPDEICTKIGLCKEN